MTNETNNKKWMKIIGKTVLEKRQMRSVNSLGVYQCKLGLCLRIWSVFRHFCHNPDDGLSQTMLSRSSLYSSAGVDIVGGNHQSFGMEIIGTNDTQASVFDNQSY